MPSLKEIQTHVQSLILMKGDVRAFAEKIHVIQSATLGRLPAYLNGYVSRAYEALAETYKTVERVLGHDRFHQLVSEYAYAHPSRSYNIGMFGSGFGRFLSSHAIAAEFPSFPDLAQFEWLLSEAFHSPREAAAPQESFASLYPAHLDRIRFQFQSPLRLFTSTWNIFEIWSDSEVAVEKDTRLVIYRVEDEVRVLPVSATMFGLLGDLVSGETLGEALSDLSDTEDTVATELTRFFSVVSELGWITGWTLDGSSPPSSPST